MADSDSISNTPQLGEDEIEGILKAKRLLQRIDMMFIKERIFGKPDPPLCDFEHPVHGAYGKKPSKFKMTTDGFIETHRETGRIYFSEFYELFEWRLSKANEERAQKISSDVLLNAGKNIKKDIFIAREKARMRKVIKEIESLSDYFEPDDERLDRVIGYLKWLENPTTASKSTKQQLFAAYFTHPKYPERLKRELDIRGITKNGEWDDARAKDISIMIACLLDMEMVKSKYWVRIQRDFYSEFGFTVHKRLPEKAAPKDITEETLKNWKSCTEDEKRTFKPLLSSIKQFLS